MSDSEPTKARADSWVVSDQELAAALGRLRQPLTGSLRTCAGDGDSRTHHASGGSAPAAATNQRAEPSACGFGLQAAGAPGKSVREHYCQGTLMVPSVPAVPPDAGDDPETITIETAEALRALLQWRIPTEADDPLASWRDRDDHLSVGCRRRSRSAVRIDDQNAALIVRRSAGRHGSSA